MSSPTQHTLAECRKRGWLPTRFWEKVQVSDNGCWTWTAAKSVDGYGHFKFDGRTCIASRLVYLCVVGEIPAGYEVDHLCRQRSCVNPSHLEAVTHRVNSLRSSNVGGKNATKTHCPRGHAYTKGNTSVERNGGGRTVRRCRICRGKR